MVLSCSRFSVVLIDSQWLSVVLLVGSRKFSIGSQWFLVVLVASQSFSLVLVGSVVLSGSRRFSMFLSAFCWFS